MEDGGVVIVYNPWVIMKLVYLFVAICYMNMGNKIEHLTNCKPLSWRFLETSVRDILYVIIQTGLLKWKKTLCHFEFLALWAGSQWLFQVGSTATEHLSMVCEQIAAACLMVSRTGCVSENGTVSMALRGSEQLYHDMLGCVEQAESTIYTLLMLQHNFVRRT